MVSRLARCSAQPGNSKLRIIFFKIKLLPPITCSFTENALDRISDSSNISELLARCWLFIKLKIRQPLSRCNGERSDKGDSVATAERSPVEKVFGSQVARFDSKRKLDNDSDGNAKENSETKPNRAEL